METFKRHIDLRDMEIVGTVNWRELDIECMKIASRCTKCGVDQKVTMEMLRNAKTKLPQTPEERITQLEKRMTALEMQLQERSREIPVIVSANGADAMKEYFAKYDI
jgi:predicted dinucleotide-utilizing enzyme